MKSKCDALRKIVEAIRPSGRPPLDVHRWWARRYHELTRGMIVSALASPVEDIEQLTSSKTDFTGTIVLDPFAGSGTTVIEALRLGCLPIGIDLNPVAWWIMRNRLLQADLSTLDQTVEAIYDTCSKETEHLYQTTCLRCSTNLPAKTYFWAWVSQCTNCGQKVRALRSAQLVAKRGLRVYACPACGEVVSTREQEPVQCSGCQTMLSKSTSSYQRGKITCPYCGNTQSLVAEVDQTGRRLPQEMLMVEVVCPEHGCLFKSPQQVDLDAVERARSLLVYREAELPLPHLLLGTNLPLTHVRRYGYQQYRDLFSERQLVTLGVLLKAIATVDSNEIQGTLLTLFSGMLEYNSMLCGYNSRTGRTQPVYARHTLVPPVLSAESNPWHESSIGGWKNRYRRIVRPAKEQLFTDSDSLVPGRRAGWPLVSLASSFDKLEEGCVLLQCASASELPLPDSSVDAVVTDPPYFDNVQYAFLSDFFYAWLGPVLADKYEVFSSPATPKHAEIVVHFPSKRERVELYANNLQRAFSEIARVLKPDAPLVYIYRVPSLDSFKRTLQWALDAGLYVAEFCQVDQSRGRAFRQSVRERVFNVDVIFYCYKRGGSRPITWETFQRSLTRHLTSLLGELGDISRDELIEAIWGEFVRQFSLSYPNVYKADGDRVGAAQAVDWMWSLASVLPTPHIDVAEMAEIQAVRNQVSSGSYDEDEINTATERIAGSLEKQVPKADETLVERDLKAQLGEGLWGQLELNSQRFLLTAEYHYRTGRGKDIDFGPTAVAFAKLLESELRSKFCRRLARYARSHHLDGQELQAGKRPVNWDRLAEGKVMLGPIEHLLRDACRPENSAVDTYLDTLPPHTAHYARNQLPDVLKVFREGRNGGAHIDPVEERVVEQLRSIVLDKGAHLRHWLQM